MTIPAWPSDLPRPLRSAYGAQRDEARIRRAVEYGPQRYRRRSSSVAELVQLKLILDPELEGVLDRFFRVDLAEGTLPFWMTDPRRDGLPMLDETGAIWLDEDNVPMLGTRIMLCLWGEEPPVKGPIKGTEIEVAFSVWDMPQ